LENARQELHAKFETALGHLEVEADQKEVEIESMQATIDKLGEQLYNLEDENDRLKEEFDKVKEEEGAERDRLEALTEALKEVCCFHFLSIFILILHSESRPISRTVAANDGRV